MNRAANYKKVSVEQCRNLISGTITDLTRRCLMISQSNRLTPDDVYVVAIDDLNEARKTVSGLSSHHQDANFSMSSFRNGNLEAGAWRNPDHLKILFQHFPWFSPANQHYTPFSFDGYVMAGGGPSMCVMSQTSGMNSWTPTAYDLDFFPYAAPHLTDAERAAELLRGYHNFLRDVEALVNKIQALNEQFTSRNEFCTTVSVKPARYVQCVDKVQFIHRGYTTPTSVVVGFDLSCCKTFFDGETFYCTLDAAICLTHKINPLDWRRESPTHLSRAYKYMTRELRPVYPGLPPPRVALHLEGREYVFINHAGELELKNQQGRHQDPSDYESNGQLHWMTCVFLNMSAILKQKPRTLHVFSKMPTEILTKYSMGHCRKLLGQVASSYRGAAYLGQGFRNNVQLLLNQATTSCSLNLKDVDPAQFEEHMTSLIKIQREMHQTIEGRTNMFQTAFNEYLPNFKTVKFIMNDPGSQFTGSFNPIIRRDGWDYWGPTYRTFYLSYASRAKFTLVCIWSYHRDKLSHIDRFILKKICNLMDICFIEEILNEPLL